MTQTQALDILQKGHSAFITGPAGCGKTSLLRQFIKLQQDKQQIAITATTGLAATHLNGRTIHSWSGIGIDKKLNTKIFHQPSLVKTIRETDILIIDEISMLPDYCFNMVDHICRIIKERRDQPFGGLQVILSGDFFQLPPIGSADPQGSLVGADKNFAVNAESWQALQPVVCYLDEQFRQSSQQDPLNQILTALRANQLTDKHKQLLTSRVLPRPDNVVELYCHNRNVDAMNQRRLDQIPTRQHTFKLQKGSQFTRSNKMLMQLIKNSPVSEELHLKEGASVMFIKNNFEAGYVNGSVGTVIGFDTATGYPLVRLQINQGRIITVKPDIWSIQDPNNPEVDLASFKQIPLKLAWAITIHKSQGMTLETAYLDLRAVFEKGMGYVALSRLKSFDGLYLAGFNDLALAVDDQVISIDQQLRQASQAAVSRN